MNTAAAAKWAPRCRPTCMKFGPYHAFDCPNHPGRITPPKHCLTCQCPKENR